ncbi:acetylesterase [Paenibacillus cisolokensis]|uniref:Acetylesterase n=1 Tax=Paenibacillus cisolokensis TaxID=1658519 RepID=A0ABQ4N7R0_9BACL|nr:alpha/beta hydrolase [Paenibacillus cisolokensis]GIQ64181.1 acetylesterase [Paenibacillus cisolokensis]
MNPVAAWELLWPDGAPLAEGNGDEDRPAIMPFLAESGAASGSPRGAIVVCPGGGYAVRAAHEGEPIARWLNGLGISAFVLRYRVAPYRYPAALLDVQRAIRTVRSRAAEWGVDPQRIGVLGFSAGGHLAAMAGTRFDDGDPGAADPADRASCRPDAMILCYPVITMRGPYRHEGSLRNLLGPEPDPDMAASLSGEAQVSAKTPPAFLWHTADDPVAVENSLMMAAALSRHGVPFDLHVYQQGRHGLGLAEHDEHVGTWTGLCAIWLKRNGWPASSPV